MAACDLRQSQSLRRERAPEPGRRRQQCVSLREEFKLPPREVVRGDIPEPPECAQLIVCMKRPDAPRSSASRNQADQIDGAGRHHCIFVRSSSFCRNDVPNSPENAKENRAARARQFGAQPVLNPSALDISNVLQH